MKCSNRLFNGSCLRVCQNMESPKFTQKKNNKIKNQGTRTGGTHVDCGSQESDRTLVYDIQVVV